MFRGCSSLNSTKYQTKTPTDKENTEKENKTLSWKLIITSDLFLVFFPDHLHVYPDFCFRLYHHRTMIIPQKPCSQAGFAYHSSHVPSLLRHCYHYHSLAWRRRAEQGRVLRWNDVVTRYRFHFCDIWETSPEFIVSSKLTPNVYFGA